MSLTDPACSRSPPALQQGKTSHRGHRLECLVRTPCESSVDRTNENLSAWSFLPRRHEGRGGEADGGVGAPLQSRQQEQPRSYDYPYPSLKLCPAAGLLTGQEQPAKRGDRPASSCDTVVMVYTTWLLTHTMVVWTKLKLCMYIWQEARQTRGVSGWGTGRCLLPSPVINGSSATSANCQRKKFPHSSQNFN